MTTIRRSTIGVEMCFLCCPFSTKKCKSAQENKKVRFLISFRRFLSKYFSTWEAQTTIGAPRNKALNNPIKIRMPHFEWNPFKMVGNVRSTTAKCKRFCSYTAGNFDDKKSYHFINSYKIHYDVALRIIFHVQNKFNAHIFSSSFNL